LLLVVHVAHATGLRNTLAAMTAVWAFGVLASRREWPPLASPALALLALAAVSAAWSPDPETTLKSVVYDIVMPMGAFYAAYLAAGSAGKFRHLASAVLLGAGLLTLLTAIGFETATVPVPADPSRAAHFYPGPGVASTLALYALPLALCLAAGQERQMRVAAYCSLGGILLVGWASENRMFWPALVLTVAVFYTWQWPRLHRQQRTWLVVGLTGVTVAAIAALVHLNETREQGYEMRLRAWQDWSAVAAGKAILGHGFGKKILPGVGRDRVSEVVRKTDLNLGLQAHNFFLNLVLQLGAAGLATYVVLLATLVQYAYRQRQARVLESSALAALLVAMLAKNSTDDFMDQATVIAFWAHAGMLLGRLTAEPANQSRRR
jgi:hypothetical protein